MSQERAHGAAGRRIEAEHRKKFRQYVRLFDRASELGRVALENSRVRPEDMQQAVCAALLGRLVRASQAGVLLALRGLQHDAIASLRMALEVLVYLKRCSESREFVQTYLRSDLDRKLKLTRASQQRSKGPEELATLERHEAYWKTLVDSAGAKRLVFEQICREAGMLDEYNAIYRLTSDSVHAAPRILDDFAVKEEGVFSRLDFGPRSDRFVLNVVSFTEFILEGIEYYSAVQEVSTKGKLARLRKDLEKAAPKWE